MATESLNQSNSLTVCTYNCKGYVEDRIEYMKSLMNECDIIFIQEHWLFQDEICILEQKVGNVSVFGVSPMDSKSLLVGRPHGGCAIMYGKSMTTPVIQIETDNPRICAGILKVSNSCSILLICIYMPCDINNQSYDDLYVSILDDIRVLCIKCNDINFVMIGGDFNTDFSRHRSTHTEMLKGFCENDDFICSSTNLILNNEFTFESSTGGRSFIDHFLLTDNLIDCISNIKVIHDGANLSDHCPVIITCNININMKSVSNKLYSCKHVSKPSWHLAEAHHIDKYRDVLNVLLSRITLPEALRCHNVSCEIHESSITLYHDQIVKSCITAMNMCIPVSKNKRIAGWSEHVQPFKERSIFWHGIWCDNGKEREGIIPNIMRKAKAEYKRAVRHVKGQQSTLKAKRMADALLIDNKRPFWYEVRKSLGLNKSVPTFVDGVNNDDDICAVFHDKYNELYSSVPYNVDEMIKVKRNLNNDYRNKCCKGKCNTDHNITPQDVSSAIRKLKPHKVDGKFDSFSDNLINGSDQLYVHLSILFNCMLKHNNIPPDMMLSTLIPIPKNRKKSLTDSNNYRSIALSSIIGKVLDIIVMDKNTCIMQSQYMQFGFKLGHSTTQCTFVMQEIIDYYTRNGSSVYLIMLDASRAFDRVHYVKLFNLLISRGMCPMYCRILAHMYTHQTLRVKWNGVFSETFGVLNGVKQGGVLSPILFCIYIDELFVRLKCSQIGCYIGNMYAGAIGYADDVSLLAPSYAAAKLMLKECEQFASDFHVMFNASKSAVILYNGTQKCNLSLNGNVIERYDNGTHLGHSVGICPNKINIRNACSKLYSAVNVMLRRFGSCYTRTKYRLFCIYCTSFYGSPLWNLESKDMEYFYVAWRKCVRKIWSIPNMTHCNLLPHICDCLPINMQLLSRFGVFFSSCLFSDNILVNICAKMCNGYTAAASNKKILYKTLGNCDNLKLKLHTMWASMKNTDTIYRCEFIKELCDIQDHVKLCALSSLEISEILNHVCTY